MTFISTRHDISFCLTVSLLIIIGISFTLSAYSGLKASYAQSSTSSNFKLYQNLPLGFSIQYPSGWQVEEDTLAGDKKVRFIPAVNSIPIFYVRIEEVEQYLDTNTMTLKNQTLEQIVPDYLNRLLQPNPWGSNLIRQNQVTVGDNPGWKIELFIGPKAKPVYYLFEILTIANGKLYLLDYEEKSLNVPETLPIVNKMVESFQFIR